LVRWLRMADLIKGAAVVIPRRYRPALRRTVRPMLHRGHAVSCPCCGGEFSRFVSHRARPRAKCPRCASLERHRLLQLYVAERTELPTGDLSVLHFAPEYELQRYLRAQPGLRHRSADIDSPLADDQVDIMDLPYDDESFDVVICLHVLEHVADDRRAMRELARVLVPGGKAIVMCPVDDSRAETLEDPSVVTPEDRARVFGQFDHVRLYGRDFGDRLAEAGFDVRVESFLDELPPERVARYGLRREEELFGREDVYLCTK
jgi:SAM-dependent methyltransferase